MLSPARRLRPARLVTAIVSLALAAACGTASVTAAAKPSPQVSAKHRAHQVQPRKAKTKPEAHLVKVTLAHRAPPLHKTRAARVVIAARPVPFPAAAPTTAQAPVQPPCGRTATPPTGGYQHVIWIWLENRSYDTVIGSPDSRAGRHAPYFNQLADSCGLATNYHNISHPSQPNYFAAVAGTTGNVTTNCEPSTCSLPGVPTLFTQLTADHLQWRSYEENMAQPCVTGNVSSYVDRHNPVVYFPEDSAECRDWDVPMGNQVTGPLTDALRTNTLPAFSFMTPDVCTDMHSCTTRTGDDWLSRWVPQIVASPAYQAGNTVLFLTFDEGEGGPHQTYDCATNTTDIGCHVATIIVSPSTKVGTRSATLFNHYGLLKTTEQLLGLPLLLGHAADPTTASMATAFNLASS